MFGLSELRGLYVSRGIATLHPITIVRGKNARLYADDGTEYIDFTSGIGVVNLGHCDDELVSVALEQLKKLWHVCFAVAQYEPYVRLAEKLSKNAPTGPRNKAVLFNSGAEAVENAVKVAKLSTGRPFVISFLNSFHGRTYLALTATGKYQPYKFGLEPFMPNVLHAPYPYCYRCPFKSSYPECGLTCLDYLKRWVFGTQVSPDRVAAVLFEPVQGEGGFVVPPAEYVRELRSFLDRQGVLLVDDEIQTGIGRTGKLFAVEHFGVEPDLITLGKALANGLPISAVVGRSELMDAVHPMGLGTTFGGNPVAAAVACKVLDAIWERRLFERASRIGEIISARVNQMAERFEIVGDVRGIGAMRAIELVRDKRTKEPASDTTEAVIEVARRKGLILLKGGLYGNVIRLHPPLTIEEELLEEGLNRLEESIGEVQRRNGNTIERATCKLKNSGDIGG
ncbi:MAG: aspartate aminotransferase family protein [Thaumarchaeota archaeon]|nr:aspartate aminotransferase family protein [Candidatus Calditenuaceae archaeon]MDW8187203.1 aspartate aminotransferase family protein [Nitrososphaerota archaeon]